MDAVLTIFKANKVPLEYEPVDMGKWVFDKGFNNGMTPEAKQSIESLGILFKGPMETPKGKGVKSINVTARKTWNTMAELIGQVKAEQKAEAEILAEAQALKAELEKETTIVEVKEKVGADGRLFGAINSKKIADALNAQFNLKLDKHKIQLEYPLKAIGLKDVPVKLHKDVTAMIRVKISEK